VGNRKKQSGYARLRTYPKCKHYSPQFERNLTWHVARQLFFVCAVGTSPTQTKKRHIVKRLPTVVQHYMYKDYTHCHAPHSSVAKTHHRGGPELGAVTHANLTGQDYISSSSDAYQFSCRTRKISSKITLNPYESVT